MTQDAENGADASWMPQSIESLMFSGIRKFFDRRAVGLLLLSIALAIGTVMAATGAANEIRYVFTHRVGVPDTSWPITALDPDDLPDLRFAVVGDVGTDSDSEYRTARTVALQAVEQRFDGLILLGDNVHPSGDPARLGRTVFDPFSEVLSAGTRLLPVIGNHDARDGNRQGQIEALGMPGPWYSEQIGDVLFIGLDSTQASNPEQRNWLESTLTDNPARWILVAVHHPPYSAGRAGSHGLIRNLYVPLFAEYGVEIVLSGHDHDYQRSNVIDGVTYIVSGAAAKKSGTDRADFTAVSWSTFHFVEVNVWGDRMELRAIDHDGKVFDEIKILQNP